MSKEPLFQHRFNRFNCCVIVPTYNNSHSLASFLSTLKLYTHDVIIINDGSTDDTANILKNYTDLYQRSHTTNQGKGTALKTGFKYALELGYEYAVTIDSDGQHYPEDLDVFFKVLETEGKNGKEMLLVGDRNMGRDEIPLKSSLGNRFSSFWYMVVTGKELRDTQSGFRLYPVKLINSLNLITWKFEMEIEVLVKAVWKKALVRNVPIKVFYEQSGRVTHFRPFWDIVRIVLLYMWLVIVNYFYIQPRDGYKTFKEQKISNFLEEAVLKAGEPGGKKAGAIATGIFIGLSPFLGLHSLLIFLITSTLKINKSIALFFTNISVLPLLPILVYLSYQVGRLLYNKWEFDLISDKLGFQSDFFQFIKYYMTGSLVLAIIISTSIWLLLYIYFAIKEKTDDRNEI